MQLFSHNISTMSRHTFNEVTLVLILAACIAVFGLRGENPVYDDSPQARHVFRLADLDHNQYLTYGEFIHAFRIMDSNTDGNVTFSEFLFIFEKDSIGTTQQALKIFLNLDVNKDVHVDLVHDVPYIFKWFDINGDMQADEGEFVIQWVKISSYN